MRDDTCALLKRATSAYEGPDTYFSDNGQERLVRPWRLSRSTFASTSAPNRLAVILLLSSVFEVENCVLPFGGCWQRSAEETLILQGSIS